MIRRAPLSDLLGDLVAYRNLEPLDPALPGFSTLREKLGLPPGAPPRKPDAAFAPLILHILREAQRTRGFQTPIGRVLVIGDSRGSNGVVASNLAALLPVRAFIGCDALAHPPSVTTEGPLTLANRWGALEPWLERAADEGFGTDETTAVLLDIDKTAMGARGRNDRPIDLSRLDASEKVLREALGEDAPVDLMRQTYGALSNPRCHRFTTDNQDYLVYTCIMASTGPWPPGQVVDKVLAGRLLDFGLFVEKCGRRLAATGLPGLQDIHNEVARNLSLGDATPFKRFRREEYLCTVARMDALPDDAPRKQILAEEITLTEEIASSALRLNERGALLFGLSDKPAEAAAPAPDAGGRVPPPIHRVSMKVLGAVAG